MDLHLEAQERSILSVSGMEGSRGEVDWATSQNAPFGQWRRVHVKRIYSYLTKEGIKHELTIPHTPQQNGVAERLNRTLVEGVRTMLADSNLPHRFWAEALSTMVYLRNRCPTKALNGVTPHEAWSGCKPDVSHLRVFGCRAYAHVPKMERQKLEPKTRKCVMLGYGTQQKGYRLYDLQWSRVIHSRDVVFDETSMAGTQMQVEPPETYAELKVEEESSAKPAEC